MEMNNSKGHSGPLKREGTSTRSASTGTFYSAPTYRGRQGEGLKKGEGSMALSDWFVEKLSKLTNDEGYNPVQTYTKVTV